LSPQAATRAGSLEGRWGCREIASFPEAKLVVDVLRVPLDGSGAKDKVSGDGCVSAVRGEPGRGPRVRGRISHLERGCWLRPCLPGHDFEQLADGAACFCVHMQLFEATQPRVRDCRHLSFGLAPAIIPWG